MLRYEIEFDNSFTGNELIDKETKEQLSELVEGIERYFEYSEKDDAYWWINNYEVFELTELDLEFLHDVDRIVNVETSENEYEDKITLFYK